MPAALLAVGLLGALVRVVYVLALGQHVELGITDASFYSAAATHLANGHGYIDIWRSLAEGTGELLRTAHHPPGWPAFLAPFAALGVESQLGHRLVGAVLGGVVVVLVGLVGRRLVGPRAGVVAAVLAALHPTLIAADGSLMSESLAGGLVLVVLLVAWWVLADPTWVRALALGATIGAAALVRGEGLLYLGLVALPLGILVARRRDDLRVAVRVVGLAAVGAVVVVAPWTARNVALFDRVVLISINDSTVLAGANCPATYEGTGIGSWYVDCIQPVGGNEAEEAAAWREQGLDHIRTNLDQLPTVVGARLLRTWGFWEPLSPVAEGRHTGTQTAGNLVWLALLLPGGIAGAVVLARRRALVALWLLAAPVAAATIVTVVGFGMLRFRHPIELSAVVLTGVVVDALLLRRHPVAAAEPAVVGS